MSLKKEVSKGLVAEEPLDQDDHGTRASKDIEKFKKLIKKFKEFGLDGKYPGIMEYCENYLVDSIYYFEKGDFFSSWGCANYGYGILDGVLMVEGRKDEAVI
ncbi:MAG: DUF357 domain-containing protein [Candidatus Bilamarchaeaceae archaeon]